MYRIDYCNLVVGLCVVCLAGSSAFADIGIGDPIRHSNQDNAGDPGDFTVEPPAERGNDGPRDDGLTDSSQPSRLPPTSASDFLGIDTLPSVTGGLDDLLSAPGSELVAHDGDRWHRDPVTQFPGSPGVPEPGTALLLLAGGALLLRRRR